jgi:energy-coupling factor transport system ATP-binding protein
VVVLERGRVASDADPAGFLDWARDAASPLQTPAAQMFAELDIAPPPVGVRQARATLRRRDLLDASGRPDSPRGSARPDRLDSPEETACPGRPGAPARLAQADDAPTRRSLVPRWRRSRAAGEAPPALEMHGVWHELRDGPSILRGVELSLGAGERVALMGRNGAGKSTLLRHAAGLLEPTRGRVERSGRVALLLQNPGDYFLHERVEQEASASAIERARLSELGARNPRDLSGGERQRLALAVVSDGVSSPAVLALDEPTRGMDRAAKRELAAWLSERRAEGTAVIVATHDVEFAAEFAERVLLLAEGRVIADASAGEVLCGGWYFTTETARILDGAGHALLPEQGREILRARMRRAQHEQALAGPGGPAVGEQPESPASPERPERPEQPGVLT